MANVFKTFSTSIIDTIGGTCQDPRQGEKREVIVSKDAEIYAGRVRP